MSLISVINLSFSYPTSGEYVFKNVSFMIDTDFKLGLIGRNGRGKTTFLKLLSNQYEYSGTITKSVEFDYFPPIVHDKTAMAIEVAEKVIGTEFEQWRLFKELNLLGEDLELLYRPFDTLSGGEQTKVLLAALFSKQDNFLLIDEPTNHLDMKARQKITQYLCAKKGFIVASHDRALLDKCTTHTLSINRSDISLIKGNYSVWEENNQRKNAFEAGENQKLEAQIEKLKDSAKKRTDNADSAERKKYGVNKEGVFKDRGFLGAKAARVMKSAKNLQNRQQKAVNQKEQLLKNVERVDSLKITPLKHFKNRLLYAKNISIFYDKRQIFLPISFELSLGERVSLCGKNGCGKSSILKLINGEKIDYKGEFCIEGGVTASYVPQDASFLSGGLTTYAKNCGVEQSLFFAILAKFGVEPNHFDTDMSLFSAGQKKKVLLASSLAQKAHIYIWDEPLNYIDIDSQIQLEQLILDYNPTLLFVEHDEVFNKKIATKTIELN